MKKLLTSISLALMLVAAMAVPAMAEEDSTSTTASVTVTTIVSITLADAGDDGGINFDGGTAGEVTEQGDNDQGDGTPAVTITVEPETNVSVDISIKGEITAGTGLDLDNWLYSKAFDKVGITGLTTDYAEVYDGVAASSVNDFYHWITIPAGTPGGSHTVDVNYKAETHS